MDISHHCSLSQASQELQGRSLRTCAVLPHPPGRAGVPLVHFQFTHEDPRAEPTMYVVFEDGSRQYMVSEQDVVRLDYRPGDAWAQIVFDRVLLYQNGDDTR